MKRQNFTIGGTNFPTVGGVVVYVHPPLKFNGWLTDMPITGDDMLVASIGDRTVEISLDQIGELIHYLEKWNHEDCSSHQIER